MSPPEDVDRRPDRPETGRPTSRPAATGSSSREGAPAGTSSGNASHRGGWVPDRTSLPGPLFVVSVLIALLLLSPVLWIVLRVTEVETGRALELLFSGDTLQITINSLVLTAAVTVASILVGVPLAVLTVQTDLPFRRFWSIVSALPLVIPSYIGAFAFVSAFGPRGILQDALAPLGIERVPEIYGLGGTVLVLTLFTYPYVYLTTRASLLSFDGTAIEAARTLNHDRWAAFRRVTLPQIKPGIAAGSLLVALYTLADFGTPAIMRYDVFTRMIYVEHRGFNPDFAAILTVPLLALTVLILAWESRINASREGAHVSAGNNRPGRITLGRWRWPSMALPGAIALLGLAVPIGILFLWLIRPASGYGAGSEPLLVYVLNSVSLSAAAAIGAVVLGLPIAYLAARSDSLVESLPERATYVGYAVPGIVLGLALVYLGQHVWDALYPTFALLVFAYVVRFVPQAVGIVESSVLQVDPKHVEVARSMGDSSLLSFVRVTFPQILPGIAAGGALVFLTTMKELPVTLLLSPPNTETLVTRIWQVQEGGYYGQAAVPALVLVAVSALSMLVILGRERYHGTE